MNAPLLLASVTPPPGDDLSQVAYAMLGAVVLVTVITTWLVTPKREKH